MKPSKNRAYILWMTALTVIFLAGLALLVCGLIDSVRRVRIPARSIQAQTRDCVFIKNMG